MYAVVAFLLALLASTFMPRGPLAAELLTRNVMVASPERDAALGPVAVAITDGRLNGRWHMGRWIETGLTPTQVSLLREANPFDSATSFDKIAAVFVRGAPIDRGDLTARR
jgi:hypothetical protein